MTNHISRKRSVPFPEGYGIFPYLIVKRGYALYQQLPIHLHTGIEPNHSTTGLAVGIAKEESRTYAELQHDEDFRKTLLAIAQHVHDDLKLPCCLVFGLADALYLSEAGQLPHQSIPSGGTLLNALGNPIQLSSLHYLKAYDDLA